jgi:hypothetical protein
MVGAGPVCVKARDVVRDREPGEQPTLFRRVDRGIGDDDDADKDGRAEPHTDQGDDHAHSWQRYAADIARPGFRSSPQMDIS